MDILGQYMWLDVLYTYPNPIRILNITPGIKLDEQVKTCIIATNETLLLGLPSRKPC